MVVVVGIFIIFPTKTTWIHNSQTHFCSFAFPFVGWSEIYRGIKIRVTFLCEPSPKSVTNRQSLPPHWWRGWIIQSSLTNWIILSSLVLSSKLSSFSSRVSWSGAKARHKPIVNATRGGRIKRKLFLFFIFIFRCQSLSQTDCPRRERRKPWFTLALVPPWLFYSALGLWWGKLSEVVQTNHHPPTTQPATGCPKKCTIRTKS